jgi:hypothetical protein
MLEEACGKAEMKKTQVYEWHKHFRDGHVNATDNPLCRQLSDSTNDETIESVCNVVRSDRRKSIQEISVEVGISVGSICSIHHKNVNDHLHA